MHIQLIEDIDGGTGKDGGTIDELIGLLLAYRKEYGGDTPVTVSYGTDEARADWELSDMFAIEDRPNECGHYDMHYADDGEKPVLDFLL